MRTSQLIKTNQILVKRLVGVKSYQAFLLLYIEEMKSLGHPISLGLLAMKSELSKSLIKGILDGNKRITNKTIGPIRKALNLPPLLSEFFYYLVATEVPELLDESLTTKAKTLAKKYAQLAIEEYVTISKSDDFFKNSNVPIVYASLGTYDQGAKIEDIEERSKLSKPKILKALAGLEEMGAIKLVDGIYVANKQFLFSPNSVSNGHFHKFYMHVLDVQQKLALRNFESQQNLFYTNVFSVNEKDLPDLREELKNILNRYIQKSEAPDGNKIIALQASLFGTELI